MSYRYLVPWNGYIASLEQLFNLIMSFLNYFLIYIHVTVAVININTNMKHVLDKRQIFLKSRSGDSTNHQHQTVVSRVNILYHLLKNQTYAGKTMNLKI